MEKKKEAQIVNAKMLKSRKRIKKDKFVSNLIHRKRLKKNRKKMKSVERIKEKKIEINTQVILASSSETRIRRLKKFF